MSVVLHTESNRRQALRDLYRALEENTTPPRGLAHTREGLVAAIGPAPMTKRVWFLERQPPANATSDTARIEAYRAYCFDPTHARKPTTNPRDHLQGNLMREQLVTCQAFVLDLLADRFVDLTSLPAVLRTASEQFTPTIRDGRRVLEKTTVGSARDVLSLYQRTQRHPVRDPTTS